MATVTVLGTYSHGTMRTQDLLPNLGQKLLDIYLADGDSLEYEKLEARQKVWAEKAENNHSFWTTTAQDWLEDVWNGLEDKAPEGYYFGAHEGDGSDYGYWGVRDSDADNGSEQEPEEPGESMTEDQARSEFGKYFCRTCMCSDIGKQGTERYSMGVYAGIFCGPHWNKSGYKKDEDLDPSYAGERMDEDY